MLRRAPPEITCDVHCGGRGLCPTGPKDPIARHPRYIKDYQILGTLISGFQTAEGVRMISKEIARKCMVRSAGPRTPVLGGCMDKERRERERERHTVLQGPINS